MRTIDYKKLKDHCLLESFPLEDSSMKDRTRFGVNFINSNIEEQYDSLYIDTVMRKIYADMEKVSDDYAEAILFQNIKEFWRACEVLSNYDTIEFQYKLSIDNLIKSKESINVNPMVVMFMKKRKVYKSYRYQYVGHLCYVLNAQSDNGIMFEVINDKFDTPFEFLTSNPLNFYSIREADLVFNLHELIPYSVYSYNMFYDMYYDAWLQDYSNSARRCELAKTEAKYNLELLKSCGVYISKWRD